MQWSIGIQGWPPAFCYLIWDFQLHERHWGADTVDGLMSRFYLQSSIHQCRNAQHVANLLIWKAGWRVSSFQLEYQNPKYLWASEAVSSWLLQKKRASRRDDSIIPATLEVTSSARVKVKFWWSPVILSLDQQNVSYPGHLKKLMSMWILRVQVPDFRTFYISNF